MASGDEGEADFGHRSLGRGSPHVMQGHRQKYQCDQETEVGVRGTSRPGPYLGFPWERQRRTG